MIFIILAIVAVFITAIVFMCLVFGSSVEAHEYKEKVSRND